MPNSQQRIRELVRKQHPLLAPLVAYLRVEEAKEALSGKGNIERIAREVFDRMPDKKRPGRLLRSDSKPEVFRFFQQLRIRATDATTGPIISSPLTSDQPFLAPVASTKPLPDQVVGLIKERREQGATVTRQEIEQAQSLLATLLLVL